MDRIQELLARLAELTQEELTELSGLIDAEVDAIAAEDPTADSADALTALADAHDTVVAEQGKRDDEQEAIATRHAEQLARLRPAEDAAAEGTEGEPAEGTEPVEGAEGTEPIEGAEGTEPVEGAEVAEPIAAAAVTRPTLAQVARRRPAGRAPERRPADAQHAAGALVAAADVPGHSAGAEFPDLRSLAAAFDKRRRALGKAGTASDGEQVVIATAFREYPADRRLGADSEHNAELIQAAITAGLEPTALVAAGGLCAPLENIYDVQVIGVTDRPVRGSLPSFQAARGGVSLRPAQQFQDWNGAVGTWDLATDASPGEATKTVLEVICANFEDFEVSATTLGLKFHNIAARTDPEGTAANIAASEIAFARVAENDLMLAMIGMCKTLTGGTIKSAARDMLHYVDRITAYYRNRRRLSDAVQLRIWLPRWFKDMVRADLVLSGPGTPTVLAIADTMINDFFAARNISVTWHLDGRITAVTGSSGAPNIAAQSYAAAANNAVIPAFPAQVEAIVAAEGDFLYLDSGELDLGLVRDSTLNSVNEYETFFEEFNGVAFRGAEAIHVVASLATTGDSEIGS